MATEVLMPKLGLTMTEGTIEEWRIKEGQPVKKGEVLFSVATDTRLRKTLREIGLEERIETVRGQGYRLKEQVGL